MVRALFTDRWGGVSKSPYSDFNLASHVGDSSIDVTENRKRLAASLSIDPSSIFFMNQVHGRDISIITSSSDSQVLPQADALVTTEPGKALAVLTADCIPLLRYADHAIAAVHVGRKGLVAKIAEAVIETFISHGITTSEITAELGPSICAECYEVDLEMYRDVTSAIAQTATTEASHCLNLVAGLSAQLENYGITPKISERCTLEDQNLFSYRRDGVTGRQVGVVML